MSVETDQPAATRSPALQSLNNLIFLSRWLQAPLYVGLIVVQDIMRYGPCPDEEETLRSGKQAALAAEAARPGLK